MGLSEQKNRTLYAADPRNLNWSQDKGRFGFKMLEKMGWSEGKGLGANEDGQREHVKIKLKTNSHGIGADKKNIRNWLSSNDGFSELLTRLNADGEPKPVEQPDGEPKPVEQPEEKPVVRERSRLSHRSRHRRMKQMALLDAKGLQEILGVRADATQQLSPPPTEPVSDSNDLEPRAATLALTQTVNAGLSATDYFAQKIAANPALAAIYGTSTTVSRKAKREEGASSDEEDSEQPKPKKVRKKSRKSEEEKAHKKRKTREARDAADSKDRKRSKKDKKPKKSKSSKST
ncbi:hypothetical protein GGF46_004273 [Coemansia sp. RSA 552]|nr:hypothetical protein GGF46_004273 [Coemansia sp. RSA 552]